MKINKLNILLLSTLLLVGCNSKNSGILQKAKLANENTFNNIFSNGKSDYSIVIKENYNEAEMYAAEELQNIIYKSTNVILPIHKDNEAFTNFISIGNTLQFDKSNIDKPTNELKNGGFTINSKETNYYINSNTNAGKIYGAYELASQLFGYEFYAIDEIKVNKINDLKFKDINIKTIPSFDGRNIFSKETILNSQTAVRYRANDIKPSWDEKFGEASIWSSLDDTSNVHQLLNVRKYYNNNPSWFYLDSFAKENASKFESMSDTEFYNTYGNKHTQLCYSTLLYDETTNGMFNEYCTNLKKYILDEPDKMLFMLGMADNELVCNCPKCSEEISKYTYSGLMMRFTNRIAKEIKRWLKDENGANQPDRELYLVQFAYLTTMEPPTRLENGNYVPIDDSVVALDNVCIRIAPLTGSNFYYDINDTSKNAYMASALEGWKKITKNFTIWDYRLYFHYLVCPYPYFNTWKTNLEIYKEMNVLDVYHQGYGLSNVPFQKMDDYVRSKLLYDLSLNPEDLMNDFINNYYKQAAPYIKEYITFLKNYYELVLVPKGYKGSVYNDIINVASWPLESLMQIKSIFDKAYMLINNLTNIEDEERETLKNRIDYESRFYRYALIDLYHGSFTKDELKIMIDEWEEANSIDPLTEYAVRESIDDKLKEWKGYL